MKKSIVPAVILISVAVLCAVIYSYFDRTQQTSSYIASDSSCIVIDAGHGGKDCGTIGTDGALEKDINFDISVDLYDFMSVVGYNCRLVRDGDYQLYYTESEKSRSDLYNRLDYVNSFDNPTLISIHQNHFPNESEWGMQVWYSPNDNKSRILADEILGFTKMYLQKDNTRQNKQSDNSYYILYNATAPSVMVECGFMSNNKENKLLQDRDYQNKIAYSVMMGFNNYRQQEN